MLLINLLVDNAWVYTRKRNPTATTMNKVYETLDRFQISRTFFLKTDQKDCALGGAFEESAATTSSTEKPTTEQDVEENTAEVKEVNFIIKQY